MLPAKNETLVSYNLAYNYFVKNSFLPNESISLKIDDEFHFLEIFGYATLMGDEGMPTEIDFSLKNVLVVIEKYSNNNASILPIKLAMSNEKILIFEYEVVVGIEQSFQIQPYLILIVDKDKSKRVEFRRI
jgi:hypothetical protein